MKTGILVATAAAAALMVSGAQAAPTTVYNTELGPIDAGTTVTDNTGTRSTNPGAGLANEAPAADEWQQRNVRENGTVGITTDYARSGNGSISFGTAGTKDSKADLEIYFSTPLLLSDFDGGSYDWFRDSASTIGAAPAPAYRLALANGDGNWAGYLVYEPYENGSVPVDSWQTALIDTTTSQLWSTHASVAFPDPCAGSRLSCLHSISEWSTANAGYQVIGISTGVGSGWNPGTFVGAVDNVSFTFDGESSSFNFEVSAVPEPATWAMMIAGFGLAGAALRRRSKAAVAA